MKIVVHNLHDGTQVVTVPIFKDNQGNVYYKFDNLTDVPMIRQVAMQKANERLDFNITDDFLEKKMKLLRQVASDPNEVIKIAQEIDTRRLYCAHEDTILQVAANTYLINDEHPNNPSPSWNNRKRAAWEKDKNAKAFFLDRAIMLCFQSLNMSELDLQTYLADLQRRVPVVMKQKPIPTDQHPKQEETFNYRNIII